MATATPSARRSVSSHPQRVRSVLKRMFASCQHSRFLPANHEFFAGTRQHDPGCQQRVSVSGLHFTREELDWLLRLLDSDGEPAPRYAVQIRSGRRVIEATEPIYTRQEAQEFVATFRQAAIGEGFSARIVPA